MTRPSLRVLWLCAGNICRSPCFEAALRDEAIRQGIGHRVASVSAGVAPWCGGKPAHRDMVAAARAAGVHIGPRTSQRLSVSLLAAADLVVPLDAAVRRTLLDDFGRSRPLTVRGPAWFGLAADDVPDPYGKPAEAFAAVAALAVDAARHLCLRLRAGGDIQAG